MKNISVLFIATFLTVQLYAQTVTPTAQFKFDGSLTETFSNLSPDSSFAVFSYGDDQTVSSNSALEMVDGAFTMPDPSFTQFGLEDFSMSVWMKLTTSLWPTEYLIMKNGSSDYFRFRYNGFFDQMNFYFRPNSDSSEISVGTASNSVGTNWNLYTVTVDRDSTMNMFLNNNLVFTNDISHLESFPADFSGGLFRFGAEGLVLNDLAFFNKALTLDEVTAIFDNELLLDDLSQQALTIYPNPVSTVLKIKSETSVDEAYEIYSLSGTLVQKGRIENGEIDVHLLMHGSYSLQILDRSFSLVIQ